MAVDRWETKELRTLLQTVARYHARDQKISDAFEKVAEKLDRSKETVQAKYYNLFQSVGKEQRDELLQRLYDGDITFSALMAILQGRPEPPRGGRQPSWSKRERAILFAEVYKALLDGTTKQSAFAKASERTQRSRAACAVRFSNEMSDAGNPDDEMDFLRNWLIDAGLNLSSEGDDTSQDVEDALKQWLNQADTTSSYVDSGNEPEEIEPSEEPHRNLEEQVMMLSKRVDQLEKQVNQLSQSLAQQKPEASPVPMFQEQTLRTIQQQLQSINSLLSSQLHVDTGHASTASGIN